MIAYLAGALMILYWNIQPTTSLSMLSETSKDCTESLLASQQQQHLLQLKEEKKTRVLVGIFTMDSESEQLPRQRYRELFSLEPDRVCTLSHFQQHQPQACELVYTFVMASAKEEDAPTVLVSEVNRTFLVQPPQGEAAIGNDLANDDITHLNIR